MESAETDVNYDTSWTVAAGSLKNSVTFESFLSPINDQSSFASTAKSPLILHPPSSDNSTPCEITISFARKHEVQQVYVRSTARVYEIYCASELNGDSEYLCTVRCGLAARDDEEVLRVATDFDETISLANQNSSNKESVEERHRNGSNSTTSEYDWVEVKALDSPVVVSENCSSSTNSDSSQEKISQFQDLYEATAEVSDANPCMSITLRLLSLQNKGCVCIDEVYIFAEPIDATDLDSKVGPTENSSGSSLMAMLMPTFMQLSKMKSVGIAQDKHDTERTIEQKSGKIEPQVADTGTKVQQERESCSSYQQDVQLQETVTPIAKLVQPEIPPRVSDTEGKPETSHNHVEIVLNQLVSRVGRIEDLFLRFEDRMLKPIRSIDERLQKVEQQLEVLSKKTQYSGSLSCTRITAPEFSCSESETNSLYNSGCVDCSYATCVTNKKDSDAIGSSILSDATPVSVNINESHPSLVVTAPEFSNCGDDDEDDIVEPVKESLEENQKHAMSIDDALASALAGFLSSTSVKSPRYSTTLSVKAPDFPSEEGNDNDETASPKGAHESLTEPPTCSSEPGEMEHLRSSFPSTSNLSSFESDDNVMRLPNSGDDMKTGGDDELLKDSEGDGDNCEETCIDFTALPMHDVVEAEICQVTDDTSNGEADNGSSDMESAAKTDSHDQFSGSQIDDGTEKGGTVLNELNTCTDVAEGRFHKDIIKSVVEFSRSDTQVNFEIPILEVKFTSQENLNARSPLEVLLSGIPGLNDEKVLSPKESESESDEDDSQTGNQSDLIQVEDWEAMSCVTNNLRSMDTDYYNLTLLPLISEDAAHLKNE